MQVQPHDEQRIVAAIEAAELVTSGEVRVHLNDTCSGDPLRDAQKQFQKLGMHRTAERNGILFFIALESHKFAVVGDSGIHAKVGQSFWEGIRDHMVPELKEGRWIESLELGIAEAGRALSEHFPHQGNSDRDELSNEVSRG
jgi:uncharacterized membrane protein